MRFQIFSNRSNSHIFNSLKLCLWWAHFIFVHMIIFIYIYTYIASGYIFHLWVRSELHTERAHTNKYVQQYSHNDMNLCAMQHQQQQQQKHQQRQHVCYIRKNLFSFDLSQIEFWCYKKATNSLIHSQWLQQCCNLMAKYGPKSECRLSKKGHERRQI